MILGLRRIEMRRCFMSNDKLIGKLLAIAFFVACPIKFAAGQTVDHAGFTYFDGNPSQAFDPLGYQGQSLPYDLMQVGFAGQLVPLFPHQDHVCETPDCESQSSSGCESNCGKRGRSSGLLGNLFPGRNANGARTRCLFCGGSGCGVCMSRLMTIPEVVNLLRPYSGAGLSATRWYDASVEATFLTHSQGGANGVATTEGVAGTPILDFSDAPTGDSLKGGVRLSTAIVFGPGGNMEVTYMGGNEWDHLAYVETLNASPTLYSLISEFGTSPNGGFDDTDRSIRQAIRGESKFHSGEWNYRRRSMGQYGRFQSSWLVGLRYVRFDSELNYSTQGTSNNTINSSLPRYFSSNDKVKNNLFGPQAGVDLWWNVRPGIKVGVGVKGAWVQNDSKRQTILTGNSLSGFATPGSVILEETRRKGTVLGELEATLIYRLTHSWSAKASYHLLAADDVVFGNVDVAAARDFVSGDTIRDPQFIRDSLVVQGATFGAEYMW